MSRWKEVQYAFPDDDGETFERVLRGMRVEHAINIAGHLEGYMLVGLSQTDRLVLNLSVDGIEGSEEEPSVVPFDKREAVEEVLPMLHQSEAHWLEMHHVTGEPYALRAFDALWQQHALPHLPVTAATS